jgi:hypothetical protein
MKVGVREHFASFTPQSPIDLPDDRFQIALESARKHHSVPEMAV